MANSNLKVSTSREQAQSATGRKVLARIGHVPPAREDVLTEATFHALLTHERRRAERSRKPFVLMLLEMHALHAKSVSAAFCERVKSAIAGATRETDLIGWYEEGRILAVIFAELNVDESVPVAELLRSKVEIVLANSVGAKGAAGIVITTHIFPESWNQNGIERPADLKLYPDLSQKASKKRVPIVVKRGISDKTRIAEHATVFPNQLVVVSARDEPTSRHLRIGLISGASGLHHFNKCWRQS